MSRILAILIVPSLLTGCRIEPSNQLPEDPDRLILFSIDGPSYWRHDDQLTEEQAKGELLDGYPVLGKVEIVDADQRRLILAGIKEAMHTPDLRASCFIPRHAIRFVKDGKVVDFVLCFECRTYHKYGRDKSDNSLGALSSRAPAILDETLVRAGIPLAQKDLTR